MNKIKVFFVLVVSILIIFLFLNNYFEKMEMEIIKIAVEPDYYHMEE